MLPNVHSWQATGYEHSRTTGMRGNLTGIEGQTGSKMSARDGSAQPVFGRTNCTSRITPAGSGVSPEPKPPACHSSGMMAPGLNASPALNSPSSRSHSSVIALRMNFCWWLMPVYGRVHVMVLTIRAFNSTGNDSRISADSRPRSL